jgi:hypothetical protein
MTVPAYFIAACTPTVIHFYLSANFHNMFFYVNGKRGSARKREGKGWELTLCLKIRHSMEYRQLHVWVDFKLSSKVTLTPRPSSWMYFTVAYHVHSQSSCSFPDPSQSISSFLCTYIFTCCIKFCNIFGSHSNSHPQCNDTFLFLFPRACNEINEINLLCSSRDWLTVSWKFLFVWENLAIRWVCTRVCMRKSKIFGKFFEF